MFWISLCSAVKRVHSPLACDNEPTMLKLQGSLLILCLFATAMGKPRGGENLTDSAVRAVADGAAQFSGKFYKTVGDSSAGNFVSSPVSAALVLAMASYGAKGETEREFKEVLRIPEDADVSKAGFQGLIDLLNNVKDVELHAANKIYVDQDLTLKPTFKDLTETYFRSTSESINFGKADEAANTINSWVAATTKNCIPTIVDPQTLQGAVMVLLNAIYFKGQWKEKFNTELTKDLPFHVNQNVVKNVPTMFRKDDFNYGVLNDLRAKFIEIPYKGDQLSMLIIVPDDIDGLPALEEKLQHVNLGDVINGGYYQEVQLYLPKFKINSKIDLKEPLQKMGLSNMFTDQANFSGMSDVPLKVSKAIQKAFIEVNEEGTEAAAVTGLTFVLTSARFPSFVLFKVDRPFFYYIIMKHNQAENDNNIIIPLFAGRLQDPKPTAG